MEWLTPAEIRALVQRSFDEGRPLDHVLAERLFGSVRAKPLYEKDWPPQAKAAYFAAASVWLDVHRANPLKPLEREKKPPSLIAAFMALQKAAPDPKRWWLLPNIQWGQIGKLLKVDGRTASYHLCDVYGFRFRGRNANRQIVAAPCRTCGVVMAPELLNRMFQCAGCSLTESG